MTRGMLQPKGKHDRGSSAVEFAIVFPLLLLMIFAIIDFGRMQYTQIIVTSAAREGARANALAFTDWKTRTINAALPMTVAATEITVTPATGCPTPAVATSSISVTVAHPFRFITPISGVVRWFGGTAFKSAGTISGTAAFRCLG